jgi:hypothetical protein
MTGLIPNQSKEAFFKSALRGAARGPAAQGSKPMFRDPVMPSSATDCHARSAALSGHVLIRACMGEQTALYFTGTSGCEWQKIFDKRSH